MVGLTGELMARCIVSLEPVSNMTRSTFVQIAIYICRSAFLPTAGRNSQSLFFSRVTRRGWRWGFLGRCSRSLDLGAMRPNAKKQPRRVLAVRALLPRDIRRPLSTTGGVLAVVPAMRSRSCFLRPYTYFAHESKPRLGSAASRIAPRVVWDSLSFLRKARKWSDIRCDAPTSRISTARARALARSESTASG